MKWRFPRQIRTLKHVCSYTPFQNDLLFEKNIYYWERHHVWRGYNSNFLTSYRAIKSIINLNPSKTRRTKRIPFTFAFTICWSVVNCSCVCWCRCCNSFAYGCWCGACVRGVKCILENSCNKISWAINDSVYTVLQHKHNPSCTLSERNVFVYVWKNKLVLSLSLLHRILFMSIVLFALLNALVSKSVFNFNLTSTETYMHVCTAHIYKHSDLHLILPCFALPIRDGYFSFRPFDGLIIYLDCCLFVHSLAWREFTHSALFSRWWQQHHCSWLALVCCTVGSIVSTWSCV